MPPDDAQLPALLALLDEARVEVQPAGGEGDHGVAWREQEAVFQLLEAVAAELAGSEVGPLHEALEVDSLGSVLHAPARALAEGLRGHPAPPALALAELADHALLGGSTGPDWRLAQALVSPLQLPASSGGSLRILDPAVGPGTLLAAALLHLSQGEQARLEELLLHGVCGADLDPLALRGTRLVLASLSPRPEVVQAVHRRLRQGDSLVGNVARWQDVGGRRLGFEAVVLHSHQPRLAEVALRLVAPGGQLALLGGEGLLRSTEGRGLRARLLDHCPELNLTLSEEPAGGLEGLVLVDVLTAPASRARRRGGARPRRLPLHLRAAHLQADALRAEAPVLIGRQTLRRLGSERLLPAVRTEAEWSLLRRMVEEGERLRSWAPRPVAELSEEPRPDQLAAEGSSEGLVVLEPPMLHQYRHHACAHDPAQPEQPWRPVRPLARCQPSPRLRLDPAALPEATRAHTEQLRIGLSLPHLAGDPVALVASRLPTGLVCGPGVLSVSFPDAGEHEETVALAFLAVSNSLVLGWLLRRLVGRQLGPEALLELPWPSLDPTGPVAQELAAKARRLGSCTHHRDYDAPRRHSWGAAEARVSIELAVARAWGLGVDELLAILADHPGLDASMPALEDEERSTVSRDLVLLRAAESFEGDALLRRIHGRRVGAARRAGAVPFVPEHLHIVETGLGL